MPAPADSDQPDHGQAPIRAQIFEPIANARAYHEVVDQITFAIRSGLFSPGERIPQIDELARKMQVSRVTIGEAIKLLSNAGVLKSRRGLHGGITVQSNNIPVTVLGMSSGWRNATIDELVDARRAVELQIAVLAAERAKHPDFVAMGHAIKLLEAHASEHYTVRIHYDHLFHYAMGRASNNRLLSRYQHEILERLFVHIRDDLAEFRDVNAVIECHRDTLTALRSRDPKRAWDAMDKHLQFVEQTAKKRRARAGTGGKLSSGSKLPRGNVQPSK